MYSVFIDGERYVPALPEITNPEVLDFEFEFGDLGLMSIRSYLQKLLLTLWLEKECFSSKRPFGFSGWEYTLYRAVFASGGLGDIGSVPSRDDFIKADNIISGLIVEMTKRETGK